MIQVTDSIESDNRDLFSCGLFEVTVVAYHALSVQLVPFDYLLWQSDFEQFQVGSKYFLTIARGC